jgi:hypothetical protein
VRALKLNHRQRVAARRFWVERQVHPRDEPHERDAG